MDFETVTVKADIDAQGNGAFPSNTNIVSHDGVPLRDILLDGDSLKNTNLGYGVQLPISTNCINVRLDGSKNGKMEKIVSLTTETTNCPPGLENNLLATKVQHVASNGNHATVFLYEVYPQPGRIWSNTYNTGWKGWKLIAGEMVLWNGASPATVGTVFNLVSNLSAFGHLEILSGGTIYLVTRENGGVYNCFSYDTANRKFGYSLQKTSGLSLKVLTNVDAHSLNKIIGLP